MNLWEASETTKYLVVLITEKSDWLFRVNEYTYQDCEYIIRTVKLSMSYAHTINWFSYSKLHTRLQSVVLSTFIASCSGNANKLIN